MEGIKHLEMLDFVVLAGYFTAIILIGSYVAKYVRHAKDYFVAGAGIPWWFAAISLWMASFSALAFVMYSEIDRWPYQGIARRVWNRSLFLWSRRDWQARRSWPNK